MERHTKRHSEVGVSGPAIRCEGNTGPRARTSNLPWRLTADGLAAEPGADIGQQIGREDADG